MLDPQTQPVVESPRPQASAVLSNWAGTIHYRPGALVKPTTIAEVQAIVRDSVRYPSPVRAKGSHHSMTGCIVADQGTVLDMTGLDRIIEIDAQRKTLKVQAGARLLPVAKALAQQNLQFYVNAEVGDLTMGSAACCATKDASCYANEHGAYEFGQASSYAIGFKVVDWRGEILEVDEQHNAELLPALRSSYGLLGIVCEVTFLIKTLAPLRFSHTEYSLEEFASHAATLFETRDSHMLYLFPFLERVIIERRSYGWGEVEHESRRWWLRNKLRTVIPVLVRNLRLLPRQLRNDALNAYSRVLIKLMTLTLHGAKSSAADQIIDYGEEPGMSGYAFSIWGFPIARFPTILREYVAFCREYYARTGFRCDLPNVGFGVRQDRSALFSYSREGHSFTLDPVSSATGPDWDAFIVAYNLFCVEHGGKPFFNQTAALTPSLVQRSFGPEIAEFLALRARLDPQARFYNAFFRELFESPAPS